MTDRLDLATPYLDAVLHALIDPERTDFEIRHLDLGRDRSVWLAELRREIADMRARSAPSLTRHIAAELYATDGTGRVTIPGPLYVVTDTDVDELLAARLREITGRAACADQPWQPTPAFLAALSEYQAAQAARFRTGEFGLIDEHQQRERRFAGAVNELLVQARDVAFPAPPSPAAKETR